VPLHDHHDLVGVALLEALHLLAPLLQRIPLFVRLYHPILL
jgi:hypothetical protein